MATQSSWRMGPGAAATAQPGGNAPPRWGPGMHRSSASAAQPTSPSTPSQQAQGASGMSNGAGAAGNGSTGRVQSADGVQAAPPHSPRLSSAESVQRDRMTFLLVGLVGNTVVATTKDGAKYIGILSSTSTVASDPLAPNGSGSNAASTPARGIGIVLSCAQQIQKDDVLGPVKRTLIIPADELDGFAARDVALDVPVSASRTSQAAFRTDTEISKGAFDKFDEGRTLQRWADDSLDEPLEKSMGDMGLADKTSSAGAWDQFAANEAKFGIKSNYEENLYTTKLDKTAKDYKERERKAEQLAKEIMGGATSNVHIAEERNLIPQGSSEPTEEERYGAVVRGEGAYVPPAARRATAEAGSKSNGSPLAASVNIASTSAVSPAASGAASKPSPPSIITTAPNSTSVLARDDLKPQSAVQPQQQSQDALGEFQRFVSQERERLGRRKAALAKDFEFQDLKKWSDKFKLSFPIPDDLAKSRTASDSQTPSASHQPRDPALQKSISPSPVSSKQLRSQGGSDATSAQQSMKSSDAKAGATASAASQVSKAWQIPKIPPFNAERAKARQAELQSPQGEQGSPSASATASKPAMKMSARASAFNPNASAFTPGASAAKPPAAQIATTGPSLQVMSPNPSGVTPPSAPKPAVPVNAYFGNRNIRKAIGPLHVREDFNPFKASAVPDASTVGPRWGFTGKPYRQLFYAIPPDEVSSGSALAPGMSTPHLGGGPAKMGASPGSNPLNTGAGGQPGAPLVVASPHLPQPSPQLANAHPQHPQAHQQQMHPRASQGAVPPGAGANGRGQPFYVPYPGYHFPGGHQPMQHMAASPYGIPPQMMAQMPFSPPMSHAGPPGIYSPQMPNVLPGGPMPNMMAAGAPQRGGGPMGAHMHPKGPPQMYYQGQPMQGVPFAAPFPPNAGPLPVVRPPQQPQPGHAGTTAGQFAGNAGANAQAMASIGPTSGLSSSTAPSQPASGAGPSSSASTPVSGSAGQAARAPSPSTAGNTS